MQILSPIIRKIRRHRAERQLKHGRAVFLSGDSFPKDAGIEIAIETRLSPLFGDWCRQADLNERQHAATFTTDIPTRLEGLQRELDGNQKRMAGVLFSRSSGGRVASLHALNHSVRAVVCLGYPFKRPKQAPEPARYEHLRDITVPTLILQGQTDAYSTFEQAKAYPVSSSVTILPVETDHEFQLSPEAWDAVAAEIRRFLLEI